MIFSAREANAILTALRYFKDHTASGQRWQMERAKGSEVAPLTDAEIDELIDRVHFEEGIRK